MRPTLLLLALLSFVPAAAAQSAPDPSVEANLCRAQLELLVSGDKLTPEEVARFEDQCDCLASRAESGDGKPCDLSREDLR